MVQFQVGPIKEKHGKEIGFEGIGGERTEKKTGWKILPQETSENILNCANLVSLLTSCMLTKWCGTSLARRSGTNNFLPFQKMLWLTLESPFWQRQKFEKFHARMVAVKCTESSIYYNMPCV